MIFSLLSYEKITHACIDHHAEEKKRKRRNVKIERTCLDTFSFSSNVERKYSSSEQKRVVHLIHHRMIDTSRSH